MRQIRIWGIEPLALLGAGLGIAALVALGTLQLGMKEPALTAGPIQNPKSKIQNPVVRRLCAADFAGRKAGTRGADRAAAWLAAELARLGLQPVPGAPRFRQSFTMPVSLLASPWDRKAKLTGPVGTTLIEYPCFRGGGFSLEAEVVFAGTGIARRDQGWDDYQGRDVRGKVVIYREGAPGPGLDEEEHARWRDARSRGALACLVLSREPGDGPIGLESPTRDFPVLRLDSKTAQQIFGQQRFTVTGASGACPLRIHISPAEDPARPAANLIGMIPGVDPAVANEAVILSAHYDHLGAVDGRRQTVDGSGARGSLHQTTVYRLPSTVYPGADDDASGVAVVLGAARALRRTGARPRRPILFCLWTAEECGLLGSQDYVDHPLLPLQRTHFVLQVEMVGAGRPDTFVTSAAASSGTGYAALAAAAANLGLTLAGDTCRGVSDHMPFLRRGVPALVVTTAGDHPNYHTSRDTPDHLNPAGIENATRLCTQAIWREANE